jgi:hypothetical protein
MAGRSASILGDRKGRRGAVAMPWQCCGNDAARASPTRNLLSCGHISFQMTRVSDDSS